MKAKTIFLLLMTFIVLQGFSREKNTLLPQGSESQRNSLFNFTKQDDAPPARIHGSVFLADAHFVSYTFSQNVLYYTPALMGGFDLSYKKLAFELATFIGKENSAGFAADLMYTLGSKGLDGGWGCMLALLGEVSWFPAQQGNPDMWIYTAGLCTGIARPFKWGGVGMGFLLGCDYIDGAICLDLRTMINVTLPVF
jgi:hypothetical protein